jgi:hypothetical protein
MSGPNCGIWSYLSLLALVVKKSHFLIMRQKGTCIREYLILFMDIHNAPIQEILDHNQVRQWERLVYLPASDTWIMSAIADEQTIVACRAIGAETYIQEKCPRQKDRSQVDRRKEGFSCQQKRTRPSSFI